MATRARGPGLFRKRSARRSKDEKNEDNDKVDAANTKSQGNPPKVGLSPKKTENESASLGGAENAEEEGNGSKQSARRGKKDETPPSPSPSRGRGKDTGTKGEKVEKEKKPGVLQRVRERSRSRSRSRSRKDGKGLSDSTRKDMLVAVTSCRSDGYYNQKAPGSISKLPRQAPKNLKLFHELAVGVKDAYAAVGETPVKPDPEDKKINMSSEEIEARNALWGFIGNLDFLLALVDEVSVDTVTRGALKQDDTFKGLRDVIKKCNRVLEDMLVRRERKYTLFFRLVQPHDSNEIDRIMAWNEKVEKAVGSVTGRAAIADSSESDGDAESTTSNSSDGGSVGSRVLSRGRQLLPTAGKVRSRRATPTPRMRRRRGGGGDEAASESDESAAGDDGYSATVSTPMSLNPMGAVALPNGLALRGNSSQTYNNEAMMAPKDELVDVIRGLRVEKIKNDEGSQESNLQDLKPNWLRKADIPSSVPKLPTEYVHRHRQMKQVVSCLLDQNFVGSRDDQTEVMNTKMITSVTSRHSDKAGNGKTTLAVAAIQTVEVRERFPDGIAWLKLGDGPLSDKDIRRLYGELYKQLIVKEDDVDDLSDDNSDSQSLEREEMRANAENPQWAGARDHLVDRADSIRRFQAGDLEGIKEDLGRMLVRRKVLICLDDVARVEDARRFIFDVPAMMDEQYRREQPDEDPSPYRILMTTRTPSLMGAGIVQEVYVRILSEHEAVKLFLSTTGRRPYGGRNSKVFNQARMIVKGCGNSPLAIRLVGSALRMGNRNWSLKSPIWMSLINQCTMNLEEASILRSFVHAFMRIVDLSFFTVNDLKLRILFRRCFVWFAMAFRDNDWMLSGKGIPRSVVLRLFETVQASGQESRSSKSTPASILGMLEKMNLVQRAGHGVSEGRKTIEDDNSEKSDVSDWSDDDEIRKPQIQPYYIMLGSLKLVAEKMATRKSFSFCPEDDQFMYFSEKVAQEIEANARQSPPKWREQLHFLIRAPSPESDDASEKNEEGITDEEANELVVVALLGAGDGEALRQTSSVEAVKESQLPAQQLSGGDKLEEYMMSFIPDHLMKARAFSNAAELLSDQSFLRRRVFALGIMEATNKEVADMLELRRLVGKYVAATDNRRSPALGTGKNAQNKRAKNQHDESGDPAAIEFDIDSVAVDGSRFLIDEIYRVTNSMGSSDSLGMATCLAAVGEGLLKCRQPRDAMLRLEEAVSLYRGILGPYHVYVAHALHQVAKALVKLGETRVALLKFAEAARIYEACNAILHYDSIQNAQSLASLLVDIGEMDRAESMFEEVIAMKMSVYGEHSVPVAKTINSYAILLAKHGRTNQAMANYEAAKATYERSPPPMIYDAEFEIRCSYDITLITLNIASIWSKKGDLQRALACYEEGVVGLQKFDEAMLDLHEGKELPEAGKSSSHKHIVSALGRIGSIKLKLRDEAGALDAYLRLLEEVKDDSPLASHTEKAKAYIKCATIYRQKDDADSRGKSIEHLREAFRMYKAIFGPEHKDSVAIKTTLDQWLNEEGNQ